MASLRRWWWLSLALIAGLWFFVARPPSNADELRAPEAPLQASRGSESPLEAAPVDTEVVPSSEIPVEVVPPEATESTRTSVPKRKREARDLEVTIRGRIVFPPELPADERVAVTARESPFSSGPLRRVDPTPHGRFEIAVSRLAGRVLLGIEGRYLHVERGTIVRIASIPAEVVLEAQLGGRIHGKIRLSAAAQVRREAVKAAVLRAEGRGVPSRQGRITDDLDFEINGLTPSRYDLEFAPAGGLVGCRLFDIAVAAGNAREVVLQAELGAGLEGRVVDAEGVPYPGARVEASSDRSLSLPMSLDLATTADEAGGFAIASIPPGGIRVEVSGPWMQTTTYEVGVLDEGLVRSGFRIVAKRLDPISGQVRWPDGTAAPTAHVLTTVSGAIEEASCDEEGRFLLHDFGQGPVTLVARVMLEDGSVCYATAREVPTGTSDLVMTLRPSETLTLRVVDEHRRPVAGSFVQIRDVESMREYAPVDPSRGDPASMHWISAMGEDGRTRYQLYEGVWQVEVTPPSGLAKAVRSFRVPAEVQELELILLPEATIRGRVVDESGEAVPFAHVLLDVPRDQRETDPDQDPSWNSQADSAGAFHLEAVGEGRYMLRAAVTGRPFRAGRAIEVRRGEAVSDVVLRIGEESAGPRWR